MALQSGWAWAGDGEFPMCFLHEGSQAKSKEGLQQRELPVSCLPNLNLPNTAVASLPEQAL